MKYLIFILIVVLSAQPVQAGPCSMDANQDISHHGEQPSDGGHDCCDTGDEEPMRDCDSGKHCGFCSTGVSAIAPAVKAIPGWINIYGHIISSGAELPSHSAPPFRPPIS